MRAWWGVTLLDGPTGVGPIVAALQPEGPAAQGGVRVGDVIRQVGGRQVRSASDVRAAIAAASPESAMDLVVGRGAADEPVTVTLGSSPTVVFAEDPAVPAAAVWVAAMRALDNEARQVPDWMLQLSGAIAQVRARDWAGAVRMLRTIEAPDGPGLGQAAVDYWLGVALLGSGSEYEDTAREAFLRATTSGGRLGYNDGPPVRPRARARLSALGLTGGGR
jgi:membrane-associated protease RseP (regulator of RpoE activity)